jgi:hypothetical protein
VTHLVHPREDRVLRLAYAGAAVIATYICGIAQQCNNFHIFRAAFRNLVAQRDLYAPHPEQHWDLFKYSPTFALLFAPFSAAPFALGLLAWNLLNVLSVYCVVRRLLPGSAGTVALALLYPALLATLDGTQSNGLVVALMVLAWLGLERGDARGRVGAALAIAAGALVKLFPLAALSFGLFHQRDRLRFFATFAVVLVVLVAAPLLVTSGTGLLAQYASWFSLERVDALDRGASVMRLLHHVAGYRGPNWPVQLAATLVLLSPLMLRACRADGARRRDYLCSLLVYAVIFNHKAEQPSFVIALVGVVVWYAAGIIERRSPWRTAVTAATIVSTIPMFVAALAPSWFGPFADVPMLATAACATFAWISMQGELLGVAALGVALRRRLTLVRAAAVVPED